MKKLIIFVWLSAILFSKEIILKKEIKETNSSILEKEILIKTWFINTFNYLTPDFLNISPQDSIFKLKIGYNTQTQKIKTSLNAKIIFPSFEKKSSKINITKTKISTKIFTFKITPLLLFHKSIPTPTIKSSFSFKNDYIIKYSQIAETIYYYFIHNEFKEITSFTLNKIINISNLRFKASKTYYSTQKDNLFYVAGIYYFTTTSKFIRTYGFEMSGERKKLPVIYNYRLFFNYRHSLFNKKFIFIDFTPYLYSSKDNHYDIKPALDISFNTKF